MEMTRLARFIANTPLFALIQARLFLPALLATVAARPAREILEIGSGQGDTTRLLVRLFPTAEITAIDYDAVQVSAARRRVRLPRVRFSQGDAASLPFAPGSFDLVCVFDTLHHVAAWRLALRESARVLRDGGRLAVLDLPRRSFGPILRWIDRPESLFDRPEFLAAAADAGLELTTDVGSRGVLKLVFTKKAVAP